MLNDWPLEDQVRILRRCGARVAVIGGVRPDDAPRRLVIEMILLGGRTSTLEQFRGLAREAGYEVVAAGEQPAGYVVECACRERRRRLRPPC